jgi:4-hydroxybenzoate polyprenyltransferase
MMAQGKRSAGPIARIGTLLEAIKFEHTIFALPFAYLGMVLPLQGLPTLWQFLWITVAMVGSRTLAMGANRLIDRRMDAANPRTANRALPRGILSALDMLLLSVAGAIVMLVAAWQLNDLCLRLAPLAIAWLVMYSYVKRVSWATHVVLGLADGLAPLGGWIAVTGRVDLEAIVLGLAVSLWIAGFDVIYACQDVEYDRRADVHSIPAKFGVSAALHVSSAMHLATALLLLALGPMLSLGLPYYIGWLIAVGLLVYEHRLVRPDDLSRLGMAFFNVNGYIAVIVFVFTFASLYM